MAEKKTAAHAAAGIQPGSGTTPAATQVDAVEHQIMQREYEALLADLTREDFTFESDPVVREPAQELDVTFAESLGSTLYIEEVKARFDGVKENLAREIRSGMCTVDQAYAYLENLEISLLLEQEQIYVKNQTVTV
ncbi:MULTISPECIES: hypothetical protein [Rothia]|uniref:Uncharacterized protein n=1 Tax=Rothia nasimurium TaxID=85336 RepID=A0A1Y1RSU6_9MICC|nr:MULTISPECIES: hypothetical protein [Rothia]ORC24337.1 hypothetical protein A7979_10065 [Rothia nasimurium]